jgi:putative ABC transport system ATP-binding protein
LTSALERPRAATLTAPLFEARGLRKRYRLGTVTIEALRGIDLAVGRGELVVVAGPSGSGKTSLFNLLGCLDEPDGGAVLFDGRDLALRTQAEKTLVRRRQLGFVFQSFNLIPVLSAFENVEYPLWIDGVPRGERRRRVEEALAAVGLADRLRHRPDQLSGGERQRVSLARALVHDPLAILADEPTANLDSRTAAAILDLLARMNRERGTTFLFATHDPAIVARAPRTVRLLDGQVVSDGRGAP